MKPFSRNQKEFFAGLSVYFSRFILGGNFSPLGSLGFFSQNPLWYALSILIFDHFHQGFYSGFLWTYAGFAAYFLWGRVAARSGLKQALFLPLASLSFFLLSNFGVWLNWYPTTLSGFILCYGLALPFYARTLAGDLLFGYGFLLVTKLYHQHRQVHAVPAQLATK